MTRKILNKLAAIMAVGVICFSGTNAFASDQNLLQIPVKSSGYVSPYFKVIISYWNNLTLSSGGKLACEGRTQVQDGYKAGITIELQQDNNGWSTIKTWNGSDWDTIYLSEDWYVESGYSYRLKLTHTALDSDDAILDSFISYSKTVTY